MPKSVLVTGANGYIGNAVARAFVRAGWHTYGLIRKQDNAQDLARDEICPIIGTPDDPSFLDLTHGKVFDVVVSNTENLQSAQAHASHLENVSRMLDKIGSNSRDAGVRLLVIFTSGCKDYGLMLDTRHGDADLAPHTEESPLHPPEKLRARTNIAEKLLKGSPLFDAIVTRPTIVYGYASSHYGNLFRLAETSDLVLQVVGDPRAIMHSVHVDDCAEAYISLVEHPNRDEVVGHAFNISNAKYETTDEVLQALAKAYGLRLELVQSSERFHTTPVESLTNFSQWVSSDKLRKTTGWTEKRIAFTEGMGIYKMAYNASKTG